MPMSTTVPKNTHTEFTTRLLWRGAVLLCVLFLEGCEQAPPDELVRVVEADPVALVITPIPEKEDSLPVYPGTIQSLHEADLGFPQAGRLLERSANVGQRVISHSLLARQDVEIFQQQHRAADADVSAQNAGLHFAMRDAQRARQLLSEQFVSPAFFEKLKAQADIAQAGVARAIAERSVFKKTVRDAELRSPFDGVVVATLAEVGQSLASGQPVVRVAEMKHVDAVFSVPERERSQWLVGTPVSFVALAETQTHMPKIRTGKVREISPEADSVTRSFRVKVELSAEDRVALPLGTSIKAGQRIALKPEHLPRYRVPMGAIYQLKGAPIVWVLTSNRRIAPQSVRLVGYHPAGAIIETRLSPNSLVVAMGAHLLQEGQLVRPEPWQQWSAANSMPLSPEDSLPSYPVQSHLDREKE